MSINVCQLTSAAYGCKSVIIVETVYDSTTDTETITEYTTNRWLDDIAYETARAEVVMFRAIKKDTLKVWAFREV